jgi:crossover junction endodeoxyribonuclease RusA
MKHEVKFDLPMPPSVNRLYANKPGIGRVKTSDYRKWIGEAGWMLIAQRNLGGRFRRFKGDVAVQVQAYRPANRQRDLDNLLKAICDLLQSTSTISNDNCIVDIHAQWVDEGVPCTVTVRAA